MKNNLLKTRIKEEVFTEKGFREDIEIEKGAVLTAPYLEENEELFRQYANFFSAYPDIFLDLISPKVVLCDLGVHEYISSVPFVHMASATFF